ncbi:family 43 glycosylhydrolase, partial [Streptomyces calidiresistens]|uniref:family 43 glycosylhydrolase n=1 Tax=Streptomyces calidiresistens TaxID=1485586 RepID=UPI001E6164F9
PTTRHPDDAPPARPSPSDGEPVSRRITSRHLFAAFTNASERTLYLYGSDDGVHFHDLAPAAYTPANGILRDPSVIHRAGRWWIAHTTAWEGGTFGIISSEDRLNWHHVADIEHGVPCHNTWAPEFFTEHPDGRLRIIVSISADQTSATGFQPYVLTALDDTLTRWTDPVPLAGLHPDEADHRNGWIDTCVVHRDGRFHAFVKDATAERVEHAVARHITGPWNLLDNAAPVPPNGEPLEGQTVFRLDDGGFRMFLDSYLEGRHYWSDSPDLTHWTPPRELPRLSGTVRHGSVWRETADLLPGDTNPVLPGYHADPAVLHSAGRFWMYPTTDGIADWGSTSFGVFSSTDLVHWTDHGTVLDLADVDWAEGRAWAPAVVERDGVHWMYFCADQQIGVARADSPTGPFVDALGKPLVARDAYGHQSIDPAVLVSADGTAHLYFGQGRCRAVRLGADMTSFDGQPVDITPDGYNEAPDVFERQGRYYLTWSENDTRSPDYQVAWAVADHPLGPFTRAATPLLTKDPERWIMGTGHQAVVRVPGRDEWYLAYHRFARPGGDGTHREVCLDRLRFTVDGRLRPVTPTLRGIDPIAPVGG